MTALWSAPGDLRADSSPSECYLLQDEAALIAHACNPHPHKSIYGPICSISVGHSPPKCLRFTLPCWWIAIKCHLWVKMSHKLIFTFRSLSQPSWRTHAILFRRTGTLQGYGGVYPQHLLLTSLVKAELFYWFLTIFLTDAGFRRAKSNSGHFYEIVFEQKFEDLLKNHVILIVIWICSGFISY